LYLALYYLAFYVAVFWANGAVFWSGTDGVPDWVGRGVLSAVVLLAYDLIFALFIIVVNQLGA
jgi:hypothetical protein